MTHPAVEAVARAIYAMSFRDEDFDKDYLENLIDEHWHIDIPYAKAAIRALLDVPVSSGMVKAWEFSLCDLNDDDEENPCLARATKDWQAMLAQLVREIEGSGG